MTYRILFVCLGNICRSPSAQGVLRAMAEARGLRLEIDSAGTGDWHVGEPIQSALRITPTAKPSILKDSFSKSTSIAENSSFSA